MEGGKKDGTRKNNCSKLKKITLSKVILVSHYKIFNLQQSECLWGCMRKLFSLSSPAQAACHQQLEETVKTNIYSHHLPTQHQPLQFRQSGNIINDVIVMYSLYLDANRTHWDVRQHHNPPHVGSTARGEWVCLCLACPEQSPFSGIEDQPFFLVALWLWDHQGAGNYTTTYREMCWPLNDTQFLFFPLDMSRSLNWQKRTTFLKNTRKIRWSLLKTIHIRGSSGLLCSLVVIKRGGLFDVSADICVPS